MSNMLPKMTVEKSKRLAQGKHDGNVVRWEYNERAKKDDPNAEAFGYADLHVAVRDPADGEAVILKVGYGVGRLTPESRLGKLLERFGHKIAVGVDVDVQAALDAMVDQKITCRVTTEKTEKGEFSRIDADSLSPAPAAPAEEKKAKK